MLSELTVENFAIIDRLHLRLDSGFVVLTGETGAGKSIIIDALQAALGARCGGDVVRSEEEHATVEAVFEQSPDEGEVSTILAEYGLQDEDTIILRREIHVTGRGSSRVNGRAVPISLLANLGRILVDIHGQTEHLSILRRDRQLKVLDRYADLGSLRDKVSAAIREHVGAQTRLRELESGRREAERRLDLLRFQVQEIESAGLTVGEEEALESERVTLMNAERLAQLASESYESLQGDARAALDEIGSAATNLQQLVAIDASMEGLLARLVTARYELEDVAQELRRYRDKSEYDPKRLDLVSDRLALLTTLKRKYGADVESILAFGQVARSDMEDVENFDQRYSDLLHEAGTAEARAWEACATLSDARSEAARSLTSSMNTALADVGLRGTTFEVELDLIVADDGLAVAGQSMKYAFTQTGIDVVQFLVSFNPGEPLRPIDKVASGGETSRFMLALKSVLAEADEMGTLIFDEVDAGVGGRAAVDVGERLRKLSRAHQVLSITHLPQIAALADQHLAVGKEVRGDQTSVSVRDLKGADRVVEIAHMMTGTSSEAARRNAEELLLTAQRGRGIQTSG